MPKKFSSEPSLFYNYFLSKLPFIIFFYLPVFALFIWLLYLRRPFTYMEHLIFTFHNQTTWFVMFGLGISLDFLFQSNWIVRLLYSCSPFIYTKPSEDSMAKAELKPF